LINNLFFFFCRNLAKTEDDIVKTNITAIKHQTEEVNRTSAELLSNAESITNALPDISKTAALLLKNNEETKADLKEAQNTGILLLLS
jgi:hypothetical protein